MMERMDEIKLLLLLEILVKKSKDEKIKEKFRRCKKVGFELEGFFGVDDRDFKDDYGLELLLDVLRR